MTPADSFTNDNTLRRRVGSLAPVSRFTFCRRSSRLPYRAVVCLPLSPRPCRRKIVVSAKKRLRSPLRLLFFLFPLLFLLLLVSSPRIMCFHSAKYCREIESSKANVSFSKRFSSFSFFFFFVRNILPRFTTSPVTKPPVGSHERPDSCIGRQKQTATEVYTVSRSTDRLTGN